MKTSVTNMMLSEYNDSPELGMGATELCFTDRHAYSIIKICTSRKVIVRRDKVTLVGGSCNTEHQDYIFEPDPEGHEIPVTFRKDGKWRGTNRGSLFTLGIREEYIDPNF